MNRFAGCHAVQAAGKQIFTVRPVSTYFNLKKLKNFFWYNVKRFNKLPDSQETYHLCALKVKTLTFTDFSYIFHLTPFIQRFFTV